ncbi:MAG: hypothetical protein PHS37_03585 [Candidatus Omnitrophica bacterium]|nr:hypothetical protein [Candidatus Omnitrophota bacterium]
MRPGNQALKNLAALCFGLALTLAILLMIETALRFHYDDPRKFYYSANPHLVEHTDLFKRSPVPSPLDFPPRVFCLGGSTTNGCNMPFKWSYPNLLDALFKRAGKGGTAYNFGISGVNSVTTNFFIKNILPRYNPNCVVIHDGYNDLPIVIKKLGDDRYSYITPDYYHPYNPYIKNPVVRYLSSFIKFNLRSTRRFVVTFVKDTLHGGGDLFLGFDYKAFKQQEGNSKDIMRENALRAKIMVETELDSIDYSLKHGIKVIVILEPHIQPMHFLPQFGTGFRDEKVGEILAECHKIQQSLYLVALAKKYGTNPDVRIMDMREIFKGRYNELFYDECHLNGKGNFIKAEYVYYAVWKLFPDLIRPINEIK